MRRLSGVSRDGEVILLYAVEGGGRRVAPLLELRCCFVICSAAEIDVKVSLVPSWSSRARHV